MTDITKIRYAGVYSGPSYGSYDPMDSMEGFTSIDQARNRYRERQETSGVWRLDVTNLTVTHGEITAVSDDSTCWPATSPQDTLELYAVDNGRISGEPFARFIAGPRGGVVRENF